MKRFILCLVLVVLLIMQFASGCTGSSKPETPQVSYSTAPSYPVSSQATGYSPPVTTSLPPEPTFISPPPTVLTTEPATNTQSPVQEKTLQFTWTTDPGIRLEEASVPNIMRLDDGRFRLYYGGRGGILSAISEDGLTFTKEPGVRISTGSGGSMEMIVSDPAPVKLQDGRVRIYYKGANGGGGPGQAVHSIFSAISADGLNFEKEGIRIDSQKTADGGWASVPEAIILPDGKVRIYYVSNGADVGHGIVSAISDDGLNFTREGPVLPGYVDPAVIRLADGEYLMLVVSLAMGTSGKTTDARPGIYSFTSPDGIHFKDRQPVFSGENNIDPAVIEAGNGIYRVYYWNPMDKPSVIRSLSGKIAGIP